MFVFGKKEGWRIPSNSLWKKQRFKEAWAEKEVQFMVFDSDLIEVC